MPTSRSRILTLVMAGGEGSRMQPLTTGRAKPALPFAGVYRLVDFPLSNCVHSHLSDVWLVEQFQPYSLNEHLVNGRPWDLDRTYGGLRILPPSKSGDGDGFAKGNADAIYQNRELIRDFGPEVIIVASADHVYKLDYRVVLDAHLEQEAGVTAVTTAVPPGESGSRFGMVRVGDGGRITHFAYKPDPPDGDAVTTELFVYDAAVLLDTLDELAEGPGGAEGLKDFGNKLLPHLVDAGVAYGFPLDGYWRDVGVVESYWQAHMDLLAPEPALDFDDPEWPILTMGAQRLPARIGRTARIDNSLIGPGCDVRGRVTRSILGPGVVIEEGAEVDGAVLFHEAVVRRGARVTRAVLDSEVEVGEGASVGAGGPAPHSPAGAADGITVVGRGARVAAGETTPAGERLDAAAAPRGAVPERHRRTV
jgi:glucose-1-phosphate adenylyltransferase